MKDKSNYCTEHKRADVLNVTHIRQSVTGFVVRKKIINWRSIEIALNITTKLIFINEIIFSNVKYIINIPILIIAQRYATQSCLFIILQVHCTCFGYQPHPSSGIHKTVTTASDTGHIFVQLPPFNVAKLDHVGGRYLHSTSGTGRIFVQLPPFNVAKLGHVVGM